MSGFCTRFFFPLVVPFFFALVTLMGGGVAGRGISSSTSYCGKNDGGGAGWGVSRKRLEVGVSGREDVVTGMPTSGISPVLSITKARIGFGDGERRRLARRGFSD